jgi:hypothetical protein
MEDSVYKLTMNELLSSLETPDYFDAVYLTVERKFSSSLERLQNWTKVLKGLDPDPWSETTWERVESTEIDRELRKQWHDWYQKQTGGLLLARPSRRFDELRIWNFSSIVMIDWETAVFHMPSAEKEITMHSIKVSILLQRLGHCLDRVEKQKILKKEISKFGGCIEEYIEEVQQIAESQRSSGATGGTEVKSTEELVQHTLAILREGSRWSELRDLTESEEVFLFGNPLASFLQGNANQTLDIPTIVADGTDKDFARLKRLLASSQSWVKDIYLRLKGVVSSILDFLTAVATDQSAAIQLARQIQDRVTQVFGDRNSINKIIRKWAYLAIRLESSKHSNSIFNVNELVRSIIEEEEEEGERA